MSYAYSAKGTPEDADDTTGDGSGDTGSPEWPQDWPFPPSGDTPQDPNDQEGPWPPGFPEDIGEGLSLEVVCDDSGRWFSKVPTVITVQRTVGEAPNESIEDSADLNDYWMLVYATLEDGTPVDIREDDTGDFGDSVIKQIEPLDGGGNGWSGNLSFSGDGNKTITVSAYVIAVTPAVEGNDDVTMTASGETNCHSCQPPLSDTYIVQFPTPFTIQWTFANKPQKTFTLSGDYEVLADQQERDPCFWEKVFDLGDDVSLIIDIQIFGENWLVYVFFYIGTDYPGIAFTGSNLPCDVVGEYQYSYLSEGALRSPSVPDLLTAIVRNLPTQ